MKEKLKPSQAAFDKWHQESCEKLIRYYKGEGLECTYGQAQKWFNMTLKYCWLFLNDKRLEPWYPYAS
ncbi:MAG: hypothetical protein Q7J68_07700 [Thermoplasmata archaeon]|nr:hypothetical protein [Thermoplasmata archaeon]